ncbi:hypothetical protein GCM10023206_07300 [Acinetobacter puyangensis]|uniref:Morphogenetic protein n=1 Tax=Acinetobacter puyangensis TaxID=1096779 RepID=A0A240E8I8_9GAMM|nr:hypothetical protein [Acinetobacter puyangensis]SNX44190.1 hypothetical protein SAMN05421731_102351 [Acinetobacter puyangensis]
MKERPILFSTPMVRAILEGRKTQTRRVLNCDHPVVTGFIPNGTHYWQGTAISKAVEQQYISTFPRVVKCPFGAVGDRLYVRETWSTHACFDDILPRNIPVRSIHYWADGEVKTGKKRSSIHMPQWASRILLEITNIRVERLNDISEADAVAEGMIADDDYCAEEYFSMLWNEINGWKEKGWNANPWVWCITFKVIEGGAT